MIKVMVAEDDLHLNSKYCEFLSKDKNIEVISRTVDGESTIKEYLDCKPDVLLLDLDMPKYNGIDILENLSCIPKEKNKCNVIIISGSINLKQNLYNTSKVYKIMSKPYNYDDLILSIKDISAPQSELEQKDLKKLLSSLGINTYSTGSKFLIQAINIAYQNPKLLNQLKILYNEVAALNNISAKKIQRSIRNSIDVMNNHISNELLRSFFNIYNNDIVTPKHFFTTIIDYYMINN